MILRSLVSNKIKNLSELKDGMLIGTSSRRRELQIRD